LREIYINAEHPNTQEVVWGYDGENNSANLNIKLPDFMVGEKFNYTVHFKDAFNKESSISATATDGVCVVPLTKSLAVGGRLKVQVVGVSSKTAMVSVYKVRVPKLAEKIRLVISSQTITLPKNDSRVLSVDEFENYDIWTLKFKINDGAYAVEAKYGVEWVATDSVLLVANEQVVKTPVLILIIKSKDGDLI
jgi:hypothetical protein